MLYKKNKSRIITEDDTFDALRRPSIKDIERMMKEQYIGNHDDMIKFLRQHHWTVTEYISEVRST